MTESAVVLIRKGFKGCSGHIIPLAVDRIDTEGRANPDRVNCNKNCQINFYLLATPT